MRRLSTLACLAAPLALAATACGDMTMTMDPDPQQEEDLCRAENHCIRDGDNVVCEDGYAWEDADDAENYNCLDLCTAENNCVRTDGEVGCAEGFEWGEAGPEGYLCVPLPTGVEVLGGYSHSLDNVIFEQMASRDDGLRTPRDIAFNPDQPDELWVVNNENSSCTVLFEMGTDGMSGQTYDAFGNVHFLARPSALAFGDNGLFATAQEEDELTQGPVSQGGTPADFMGPTLWTSDLSIFDGGHSGHYDMLHNSPNSVGIAWETENVYWVYDGYHGSLTRYDFNDDHGPGGADHSDGVIYRYVDGEMGYFEGVSSSLVYDHETGLLYAADSANNKIVVLDTNSGQMAGSIFPNYDGVVQRQVGDATLSTVVEGSDIDNMVRPSGLELHDGHLYVSDNATGHVFAFDLDGELVDWIDTGLGDGALQGMAFNADGELYLTDTDGERIWRLAPVPAE